MLGIGLMLAFLACGVLSCWALMPGRCASVRVHFGLCLGLLMMMVLPSAMAFFVKFSVLAQWIALGVSLSFAAACWLFKRRVARGAMRQPDLTQEAAEHPPLGPTLWVLLPFLLLGAYLLYTHDIRPAADGSLHVGQSTYGDLSLHLGIATGLRNASFPPEYTLLPGTLLGYPFLADAQAASMLLLGTNLSLAFQSSAFVMMGLVFWGYLIFAYQLTQSTRAAVLSFLLLFVGGGLGFIYVFDGFAQDLSRLREVFTGFYQTPTNIPDLNLRWVNPIADLLVPQRTLLAGWAVLLPALMLLVRAMKTRSLSAFMALGAWAGLMPMVHTHSFFALGMISLGAMVHGSLTEEKGKRVDMFINFVAFGLVTAAIALPQLLVWTFPQSGQSGALKFHFNWVNFDDGRFIDGYLWFWIKNVGITYILMLPAALLAKRQNKTLAVGCAVIYVVAELFLFQTNPYDNNKLFIVAYLVMLPLVSAWVYALWDRIKGLSGRWVLAVAFLFVAMISGALSLGREVVSDYQLFGADDVRMARWIDENAPQDATVLTGQQHCNAVSSLAGRKLVCGTPTFLYFHGVDYSRQQAACKQMFENPRESAALFAEYAVDYIYVSSYERGDFAVDEAALRSLFPSREHGSVAIYAVSERARATLATFPLASAS